MTEDRHRVAAREWLDSWEPLDFRRKMEQSLAALLARVESEAVAKATPQIDVGAILSRWHKSEAACAALYEALVDARALYDEIGCDYLAKADAYPDSATQEAMELADHALADTAAAAQAHDEDIRAEERERCAKVAEDAKQPVPAWIPEHGGEVAAYADSDMLNEHNTTADGIAHAIRALALGKP